MGNSKFGLGRTLMALMIAGNVCLGLGGAVSEARGQAMAASAADKAQGRRELEQIVKLLQAVDIAYAAGNAAEAQARYGDALAGWKRISPLISAREAREQQLLFESLGNQLKTSATAVQIKSTVSGMVDELGDDIAAELK